VGLVSLVVIAIAIPGVLAPALVCASFVVIAFCAGVGPSFASTYAKLFAVVGLILFVLRAAFIPGSTILFTVGPIAVSLQGVVDGARFTLAVMAMCGAVTLFFSLVPMKYLMLALELKGMTPRATYVILASFQSIIDLGKNAKVVMDAQKSRGIETEGSIAQRVRAFVPILAPVFLAAMNQTEERALALDARAFNSRQAHSHLVSLHGIRTRDIAVLCAALALAAVSIVGALLTWY